MLSRGSWGVVVLVGVLVLTERWNRKDERERHSNGAEHTHGFPSRTHLSVLVPRFLTGRKLWSGSGLPSFFSLRHFSSKSRRNVLRIHIPIRLRLIDL